MITVWQILGALAGLLVLAAVAGALWVGWRWATDPPEERVVRVREVEQLFDRSVMQKPSLGRIVIVPANPNANNGADVAPAIITRVWSDTLVNCRVLLDGTTLDWKTSITLYAGPDELAEALAKRDADNPHMVGTPFFGAYWPPRV